MEYSALFRRNNNQGFRNFATTKEFHAWFKKEQDVLWAVLVRVVDGAEVATLKQELAEATVR